MRKICHYVEEEMGSSAREVLPKPKNRKLDNRPKRSSDRTYFERIKVPCQVSEVGSTAS